MKSKTTWNLKTVRHPILFLLIFGMMILGLSDALYAQETSAAIGPLPNVPIPASNLQYQAKVELGKRLYFDNRLSGSNTRSCAFCHSPESGFTTPTPQGVGTKGFLGRNNPTVYNAAYNTSQFWDGRAGSLEEQALGPIQNPAEMDQKLDVLVKELSRDRGYVAQFKKVFGTGVNAQGIAEALASFERTIISTNSAFDKFMEGDGKAMKESAQRGMKIFQGKGQCVLCHNGPNFTDNKFHNAGVPQIGPLKEDLGRYNITKRDADRGAFKTPTLRSVTETAPYMHDGAFKTLEEVVDFYNKGGGKNPHQDPFIQPLNLTDPEKKDLVEFLKALTGEKLNISMPREAK
jgi:cytochrome c peroxidase